MTEKNPDSKRFIPDVITPNKITLARIFLIPVFMVLFLLTPIKGNYYWAAGIFAFAALTDFADGHIARKYNMVSNMGKFLDPIADKVLVSTALILLMTQPELFDIFEKWGAPSAGYIIAAVCVSIIMARELIISGFRQVAATTGLVLAAEKLGKYKTTFQDIAIVVLIVSLGLSKEPCGIYFAASGFILFMIATVLTVISGASYIIKNRAVLKKN